MFWTISIQQWNSTKQARLFELAFAARRGSFFHFRKKNFNRVWKSRWSQFVEFLGLGALALPFNSRAQSGWWGEISKRGEAAPPASPFRCRWGLALIARRNVCDSSHTFAPKFGDVWRGYLRKSSPFTSFSLTFGKLTIKFELLFQFRKTESYQPSAATYGKVVPSRPSHLSSVS